MKKNLNVAICQMTSSDNWQKNVDQVLQLSNRALQFGSVDLMCFPENSLYMRVDRSTRVPSIRLDSDLLGPLSEFARGHSCYIYLGSVPLEIEGHVYNSSVILTPDGGRIAPYQKIHLFDIALHGQDPIRESAEFKHGEKPAIFEIKGWKLGLSICYDLRFSELYHQYQKLEVDIIGIPSAFLKKTGEAHWHTLIRARAIESQAFVIAAAQAGTYEGREAYGHSMIVGPWGEIIAECEEIEDRVKRVSLDHSLITKVRSQIPMREHRRL